MNSNQEDDEIIDGIENDEDDDIAEISYDISSYGADYDTEGLVKRINRGDIEIPPFQREYVWRINEASRFIESILLGLPVPGIFLAKEKDSNKLIVIDGQQRLKTLQFFYEGYFNPKEEDKKRTVFALKKVQKRFEDATYNDLSEEDRRKLNDYLIHATIIKQESPEDDNTSIYHVFERLNSEGRKLTDQEIRTAIFNGNLIDLIKEINSDPTWREIFGKKSVRMRDQELILRFFAFYFFEKSYKKPMTEFLNIFSAKFRYISSDKAKEMKNIFIKTMERIYSAIGKNAFKLGSNINAAVFDSISVNIARILDKDIPENVLEEIYNNALGNADYQKSVTEATSDEKSVKGRFSFVEKLCNEKL